MAKGDTQVSLEIEECSSVRDLSWVSLEIEANYLLSPISVGFVTKLLTKTNNQFLNIAITRESCLAGLITNAVSRGRQSTSFL